MRRLEENGDGAAVPQASPITSAEQSPSPLVSSSAATWRLVVTLALPVLAQQSLVLGVMLSDRFLAGHLPAAPSEEIPAARQIAYQAAQTTANYLAWFITSYTVLVSVGSTALVARFVGAGARQMAIEVTHQALLLAVILGALASVLGLGGGIEFVIKTLGLEGEAEDLANRYLQPLFWLLIFQVIESAGIACLVGAGDTRTGLWVMVGVAVLNLPLAWGFVQGWWPLPRMGFVGIALGTALSHALGGLAVLAVLARGRFGLRLRTKLFLPNFALMKRLLRVSVPAALDSLSVVVGQFWFLSIVNKLGDEAASAHGIALGWEALGYLSGAAFGTAAMTLVGQNLGAGKPERATRSGWVAFAMDCGLMSIMGAVFFVLAEPMFRLFCPHEAQQTIVDVGVPVLRLVAFAMPALASTIIFTQSLRGAGDTRVPVLITWVGFFLVRIPLAYFLALPEVDLPGLGTMPACGFGLLGAWLAMFADLVVRGAFFLLRFATGRWQTIRV